ncbi:hypothetical protein [Geopseudomonas aromaticivorans]
MKKHAVVRTPSTPFNAALLEPGREREAARAIAERYRETQELSCGQARELSDWHLSFANAILHRDAGALRYLANGLNDVAKAVFSEVTGVALPQHRRDTWNTLREWAGISPAEEAVRIAQHRLEVERRAMQAKFENPAQAEAWVESQLDAGFTRISEQGREVFLVNEQGLGHNLSVKGSHLAKARPFIVAAVNLRQAQMQVEAERPQPTIDELFTMDA